MWRFFVGQWECSKTKCTSNCTFYFILFYLSPPPFYKPLCRELTFNRSQRGSCSATYEAPTRKQVLYEWCGRGGRPLLGCAPELYILNGYNLIVWELCFNNAFTFLKNSSHSRASEKIIKACSCPYRNNGDFCQTAWGCDLLRVSSLTFPTH